MKEFTVAMSTAKEMLWEAKRPKHNFVVTFRLVAFIPSSCLSTQTNGTVTTTVRSTNTMTRFWYQLIE